MRRLAVQAPTGSREASLELRRRRHYGPFRVTLDLQAATLEKGEGTVFALLDLR